ncbi:CobW family GTP-binding protein [Hydrogenophaga sp. SL48]|uniref:CobW family GTP-binding protein n=1 Tax=Hydrogenophaga sp. SL48 TaxID=2806347 RepID=UPI001F3C5C32|nr:GTP-binding protein [Hydrogenophaga sp. SL48]UJW82632.1 GTP-binding protein [Hydrogenophaga sp. SL48]
MTTDPRTPVTVITGFLGSGKTTLLQQLMQRDEWRHTAVIINELGETGLDHLLVQHVAPHVRLLKSGCLCCSVREDLTLTLTDLLSRRQRKELSFERVVVETTGLADPLPVMHTLTTHPALARDFRLAGVVTVVDTFNGFATLDQHEEARRQVAVADALLLSKCDLVQAVAREQLEQRLGRINPSAPLHRVDHGALRSEHLLYLENLDNPFLAQHLTNTPAAGAATWLFSATKAITSSLFQRAHPPHASDIQTLCLTVDEPFEDEAFRHWLGLLTAMRGERLLRFKGLIHIAESPVRPLVVHAAQHLVHPPVSLAAWPDADRRSRLVFITQGMEQQVIENTLHKFTGARAVPSPT